MSARIDHPQREGVEVGEVNFGVYFPEDCPGPFHLHKNGSPTRGGVRVEDGRPIPVKKMKTKTKNGKTKQKWGVLPVGAQALSPIRKPENKRKNTTQTKNTKTK